MATFGASVYGASFYGVSVAPGLAGSRAVQMLPALFTATKQGQILEDISNSVQSGEVVLDLDMDVAKMTFSAELTSRRAVVPFNEFVAPFLRLVYEDGSEDYEQIGLFALIPAPATHYPGASADDTPGGSFSTLDGRDLCWLLDADRSTETVTMAASANVIADAIADLASGGITRVSIPANSLTSGKAVSWPPGTSRLKRVNERLNIAGYYTLAFDRYGIGVSFAYRDLATAEPAVRYSGATGSRIVPPIDDAPDLTTLCNRVVVIGSDPAATPIYAIRENTDPTSPVSPFALGTVSEPIWITRTEERPEIQTQGVADALAGALIRDGASYYRTLALQTLPDPARNPREVYELDVSNADGVVADGLWWCSGWTLSLDWTNPTMVHTLHRIQPFQASTP